MLGPLNTFWQKMSNFGVPHDVSPDERKLHVSGNQLIVVTLFLIGTMTISLLLIWLYLLTVDFKFYENYYWGGTPPLASLLIGLAVLLYRGKTGRFFGPIVLFAYLMLALITAVTIIFGAYYGMEFWIPMVMGMGVFVLHKRPRLRRLNVFISLILFIGLRLYNLYFPELLPVPHAPTRFFYYVLISIAIFVFFVLEFRFIAMQSAKAEEAFVAQRDIADKLLLNIMPESVARELKANGNYEPRHYDAITVIFTDFVGFTKLAATMHPTELLKSLDDAFRQFDLIVKKHGLEKLKTIGDAYMCAAGIPEPAADHALRACRAALEFKQVIEARKQAAAAAGEPFWDIRIGLHSGPVVAGIIGDHKFAYDIWGDTVNIASRMESSGEVGKVNISSTTAAFVKEHFALRERGLQAAKGLGDVEMFELVAVMTA